MLKKARKEAGMTQLQLAEAITERRRVAGDGRRVEQVSVSRWEGDDQTPSADVFGELLVALGAKAAFTLLAGIAVGLALAPVRFSQAGEPWRNDA